MLHVITSIESTIRQLFCNPMYGKFMEACLACTVLTLSKDGIVGSLTSARLAGLITMHTYLMTQNPTNANVCKAVIHLLAESFHIEQDLYGDTAQKARALIVDRPTTKEEISGDLYSILMSEARYVFDSFHNMKLDIKKIDPDRAGAIMTANNLPYQTHTDFFRAVVMEHYAVNEKTLDAFLDPGQTWCQPKHYLRVLSEYTLLHDKFGISFAASYNKFTHLHEWINPDNRQVVCSVFTTDNDLYGDSFFQHIVGNPMERFMRGQQYKNQSIGDMVLETLLTRQPSDTKRKEYTVCPVLTNGKWIAKLSQWKTKTKRYPNKFHLLN